MQKHIKILGILLIFFHINTSFCEVQEVQIPIEDLIKIKENLFVTLSEIIKTSEFQDLYPSKIFNTIFVNSPAIKHFINSLPLSEILYNNRLLSAEYTNEYIINLYLDNLSHKQKLLEKWILLTGNIIFCTNMIINKIDIYNQLVTIKALEEFVDITQLHPDATEPIGIITPGAHAIHNNVLNLKNILLQELHSTPKGFLFKFDDGHVYLQFFIRFSNDFTIQTIPFRIY